jgi:hypothetical protein
MQNGQRFCPKGVKGEAKEIGERRDRGQEGIESSQSEPLELGSW